MLRQTICLDFDGVVHHYITPWVSPTIISDDVTPGFFEWADQVYPYFNLVIYSARSKEPGGIEAMQTWLVEQRSKWEVAGGVSPTGKPATFSFSTGKPAAILYVDDRGLRFEGDWSTLTIESLKAFLPWNRRPK